MKRLFLLIIALSSAFCELIANNDVSSLAIGVVQPERDNLSVAACKLLKTKMTQLLSQNGIVNDLPSDRFVLTAKADLLNKDIISGSPIRVSEQLLFTFMVGDVVDNKKYESYSITLVGVGGNEQQAVMSAIKTIRIDDTGFVSFIESAKTRIVSYYAENEDRILKQADILSVQGHYDEALYHLSLVPSACGVCFDHCQDKILEVQKERINAEGASLLTKAKATWAKNPNKNGAEEVYPIITNISTQAACYPEVSQLIREIREKLVSDDARAWDFKLKQYEDEKAREQRDYEFKVKQYNDENDRRAREAAIRQQEISAARDVALEYAKNMPDVVYESIILW